jgi:hypothetical protein
MTLRITLLAVALAAGPAVAQDDSAMTEALGTFDQIAIQWARGGSDADVDGYRLKLWHAYLTASDSAKVESDRQIQDRIDALRRRIEDSEVMRRQYWAARVAIPQAKSLDEAQEREFYKLCEAPKVQGLPDPQ